MADDNFSKINLSKSGRTPILPFLDVKKTILGARYNLSLVFCDNKTSRKLNKERRAKDKPTNVLSFPLSKNSGEIFLDLDKIKKEVAEFQMPYKNLVLYLYIHGLLHLKGLDHSPKMETLEKKFLKKYKML